jgi:hypothetical protein
MVYIARDDAGEQDQNFSDDQQHRRDLDERDESGVKTSGPTAPRAGRQIVLNVCLELCDMRHDC